MTRREIIENYAHDCINGNIPSCKKHINACKRLLSDFHRLDTDSEYPFYWDEDGAENIVKWFSLLRHSKGELSKQPINLTEWQQFHICQLYGWKRKKDGRRRFKRMFIEVSRKNAKSQEQAGICLYECAVTSTKNGEADEIYTAGGKREESRKVFDECELMLRGSPLRKRFDVNRNIIRHKKTGSYIKPLSKDDGKNGDGSNPAVLVLDEYHQHKTTEFYDLAIGSNTKEPLLIIITTAGRDLNVPCYREYQYAAQIIDPDVDVEDDAYLIDICEQDKEEAENTNLLNDKRLWIKSNPIRATYQEGIDHITSTFQTAKNKPEEMPSCLTKAFDIWLQARADGYMDMSKWKNCEISELPFDLKGRYVTIGVDLSVKLDLTSAAFCVKFLDNGVTKFLLFHHSFVPNREKLLERELTDKAPYTAWERLGYISVTNTPIVDQEAVMLWCEDYCKKAGLKIKIWAIDPANASLFETMLSDKGYDVLEVYQSFSGLSEAVTSFREDVYSGNVLYLPDPVLSFAMSNCITREKDKKILIDKPRKIARIDPAAAVLDAYKYEKFLDSENERVNAAKEKMKEDILKTLDDDFWND